MYGQESILHKIASYTVMTIKRRIRDKTEAVGKKRKERVKGRNVVVR